jgi:hypothetical protein
MTDEIRAAVRAFLPETADRTSVRTDSQAVTAKSAAEAGTIHSIAADPSTLAARQMKRLVMDLTFRRELKQHQKFTVAMLRNIAISRSCGHL